MDESARLYAMQVVARLCGVLEAVNMAPDARIDAWEFMGYLMDSATETEKEPGDIPRSQLLDSA